MMSESGNCAYDEGYQARLDGITRSECPYQADAPEHDVWMDGWEAAQDSVEAEEAQDVLG